MKHHGSAIFGFLDNSMKDDGSEVLLSEPRKGGIARSNYLVHVSSDVLQYSVVRHSSLIC